MILHKKPKNTGGTATKRYLQIGKRLSIIWVLAAIGTPLQSQLNWPAVTQQSKPWARWWWQGSAVNERDLHAVMQTYRDAGLGGLEIVPIYGVKGYEPQFVPYLGKRWMQLLDYTLQQAKQWQLGIDLANGTGWPFGGPWIGEREAAKTLLYRTYELKAGESLTQPVTCRQEALVRTANNRSLTIEQVKQPLAANNLQALALDQVKFPATLPARLLMAYGDGGRVLNLTRYLDTAGHLRWKAPAGQWKLYALFQGLHGKMVERAAPGGEGYAVDHFSATAIKAYFNRFDEAFRGHDLRYLRALFNDSYEVDDARGQADWSPAFLQEFRQRRGYALQQHLPALFGQDSQDYNSRIIYDYRLTIHELLLEHFTQAWKKWGQSKGALIRNQSHGSPANILDLYAAIDIPETEGDDILRFKFATSAAHVSGKPLVSAESATWLNEHFLSTLGDVKKAIDGYFLGGVNHVFYHGLNYSPPSDPWPGWLFYAAVHFQPANPFWAHLPALNRYIARNQSFLQQGRPDNDVLLYYPISDRFSDPGKNLLRHFDGMDQEFDGTGFKTIAGEMQQQGYAFDYVSDQQLLQTFLHKGRLQTPGGGRYATLVLPGCTYIPLRTWQHLLMLVQQGAKLVFYRQAPQAVPGFAKSTAENRLFRASLANLSFTEAASGLQQAMYGKGTVWMGSEAVALLAAAGVRREAFTPQGLQFVRRRMGDSTLYLVVNQGAQLWQGWLPLQCRASAVARFNALDGSKGWLPVHATAVAAPEAYLQLQPGESALLLAVPRQQAGKAYPAFVVKGPSLPIGGSWQLQFAGGNTPPPSERTLAALQSWTSLQDAALDSFSGTCTYQVHFPRPQQAAGAWLLNLGRVAESATLRLNGRMLDTLILAPFTTVFNNGLLQENNLLEITVANTMANRIIALDKKGGQWKKFYNTNFPARLPANRGQDGLFSAAGWQPLASGLLGPVTITPLDSVFGAPGE